MLARYPAVLTRTNLRSAVGAVLYWGLLVIGGAAAATYLVTNVSGDEDFDNVMRGWAAVAGLVGIGVGHRWVGDLKKLEAFKRDPWLELTDEGWTLPFAGAVSAVFVWAAGLLVVGLLALLFGALGDLL